ncbi:hypothetical protein [Perlabentimonas gracilis]|uniref:hypothetical protein n=1 Tax=Perlabentimonas gracilis TaxID=2715279 RepID=UPI00140C544B|nr:hypothetical protein [Perlabentimonas gracilis]NHB69855.1 hypothetical protein [Perlabentimonas gracilis]
MRTNDIRHWLFDFILASVLLAFIFVFKYELIIEIRLTPGRTPQGAGISALLRSIDMVGGKSFVYGFLGIAASFFFAKGMRKFIKEWRADEPQDNEKNSPAQLIKHYQTLCDVLLARGHDDAYNELTRINVGKGTASWAKKVGEALSDLEGNDPVAFKSVAKWAKFFMEID